MSAELKTMIGLSITPEEFKEIACFVAAGLNAYGTWPKSNYDRFANLFGLEEDNYGEFHTKAQLEEELVRLVDEIGENQ